MRFSSSLFLQQATGRGGVIPENDGELILPPVIQASVLLGMPHAVASAPPAGVRDDSFFSAVTNDQVGINAGATVNDAVTLASGLWFINGRLDFVFIGTVAPSANSRLNLFDQTGVTFQVLSRKFFVPGAGSAANVSQNFEFWLPIYSDGWFFQIANDVTVAGDTLRTRFNYQALKIM